MVNSNPSLSAMSNDGASRPAWRNMWFSFSGRLPRKAFWLRVIVPVTALYLVGLVLLTGWMTQTGPTNLVDGGSAWAWIPAVLLPMLLVLWIWAVAAATVKRLHDQGKSGWHFALCWIPLVGTFYWLFIGCRKGTAGSNRFGA